MAKEKSVAEKKATSLKRKNAMIGYTFILPNFLGFAIFILIPVVFTLILVSIDRNFMLRVYRLNKRRM